MSFKLDWNLLKETVLELRPELSRRDFINFEERINFHQLPALPYTEGYAEKIHLPTEWYLKNYFLIIFLSLKTIQFFILFQEMNPSLDKDFVLNI